MLCISWPQEQPREGKAELRHERSVTTSFVHQGQGSLAERMHGPAVGRVDQGGGGSESDESDGALLVVTFPDTERHFLPAPWDIWGPVVWGWEDPYKCGPQSLPSSSPGWLPRLIWAGGGRLMCLWVAGLGPGERADRLSGKVTIYSFRETERERNESELHWCVVSITSSLVPKV